MKFSWLKKTLGSELPEGLSEEELCLYTKMRSQHEVLVAIKDAGVPLSDHILTLLLKCDSEYTHFMAAYLGRKRKDRERDKEMIERIKRRRG
ncbi:hypothetical protein Droror1_Dr00019614 [Drosera rotundifolia]